MAKQDNGSTATKEADPKLELEQAEATATKLTEHLVYFEEDEFELVWKLIDQAQLSGSKNMRIAGRILDKVAPLIEGRIKDYEEQKKILQQAAVRRAARRQS